MTTSEKVDRHRILFFSSLFHFTNDACFALLSPLLPFIAAEFHLSYLQSSFLKTVFTGSSGLLQVPASLLGEHFGELLILAIGNIWVGLGITGMALAPSYYILLFASFFAGIGGNAQHPLAVSLVTHSYDPKHRARTVAILNMSGTLGKLFATCCVVLLATYAGWRAPLFCAALLTLPTIFVIWQKRQAKPSSAEPSSELSLHQQLSTSSHFIRKAALLISVGCLDEIAQKVALTFLPFLFAGYGLNIETIGLLTSCMLLGGIVGKFVCSWLSERWGAFVLIVSTEILTALAFIVFPVVFITKAPFLALVPLSLLSGIPLDGTSSLLQSSLSVVVPDMRKTRWYGLYCTATLMSSSLAVIVYGALADWVGITMMFVVAALLTALIPLLIWPLRQSLDFNTKNERS